MKELNIGGGNGTGRVIVSIVKLYSTKALMLADTVLTYVADGVTIPIKYGDLVAVNNDTVNNGIYVRMTNSFTFLSTINDLTVDTERATAEAINVMYGKVMTLEAILAAAIYDASQIDILNVVKTLNIFGTTNMILSGTAAPAITPDFIGQRYIKTTATKATYTATGITSSGDWLQDA